MVKKMKFSRLVSVCLCCCLFFSTLCVGSSASIVPDDYPTQLPFVVRTSEAEFYTDLSSTGVIESVLHSDPVVNSFVNGSDFTTPLITSDATAFRITFLYDFDDPSYVDGQTYRFSFKVNEPNASTFVFVPQDNYRTATVIANAVYNTLDQIQVGSVFYERDFYDLTVDYNVEFTEPKIIKTGLFEFTDTISIDLAFDNIYSASVIYQDPDGNYVPDYTQPMVPQIPITFFLVFRNSALTQLTLSDVTLSPIGHTKDLYDDVFFQEGMLGGMQDLEDQMSDVNDKLEDVIGSDEEGSESGIKGILQKIKDLPSALIDGIKNLFIPSDQDIQDFKDKFDILLTDKLGVLWQAPNLIVDFIQILADFEPLRSDDFDDYYIEFPSKEIYINSDAADTIDILSETDNGGTLIPFIPSNTDNNTFRISFGWLGDSPFSTIYGIYEAAIIFISIIGFCYYCIRKYQSIMGE